MSNPYQNLLLLPVPKELVFLPGFCRISRGERIALAGPGDKPALPAARRLQDAVSHVLGLNLPLSIGASPGSSCAFIFSLDSSLGEQTYELSVTETGVRVTYGSPQAAYYAVATLKQLIAQTGGDLPCLHITDEPDFPARGLMIDISRNKIPNPQTLRRIVDLMADLKLNQLQLYIEGMPFNYESFPGICDLETPISGEEILELDEYCRERCIELVPNQNSFGHMEGWLSRPEFNHLAEIPEGFVQQEGLYDADLFPSGLAMRPGTFYPEAPEVTDLLEQMYDDLLPYFSSGMFNVGCDETYELGMGRSKGAAESLGKGKLYLSFLLRIAELVRKRGKTMQFWGDIIIQHPELIPHLPKDIIAMEWGYSAEHPFEADTQKFRDAGIPFYVCPGTSSWNSVTGRTDNMLANLKSAAIHGKKNGAIGYLITDWGDNGHWQHLPVSYAGFVYGGSLAWSAEASLEADIAGYMDRFLFSDASGQTGRLLLDLGNYYKLESGISRPNDTEMSMLLRSDLDNMRLTDKLPDENLHRLEAYMQEIEERLGSLSPRCDDADLVLEELQGGVHFIRHAIRLAFMKRRLAAEDSVRPAEIRELRNNLDLLLHHYKLLWCQRNRMGGLEQSVSRLVRLRSQYEELEASLAAGSAGPRSPEARD
ncbi:Glycosyl hydrolase family 20, domain 2 [Paenibacillus sophorae]|uniref:beta-N-acetylhexosaminidase n=1 Tax=Paenibacillus sophorae TaxID=1333845 RepID=A0A1H8T985_9BACL|nr:family 20 glycosylhydrolase [Paenibacillus sophorae]QWU17141.1 family 20 glycosylhydrolase [Paenibacillus sophorae]SEO87114.1 Glycosyl hydrolase family 20, domain 2 [Paenibacillus sophorae]